MFNKLTAAKKELEIYKKKTETLDRRYKEIVDSHDNLIKEHRELISDYHAECAVRERYRTAFLDRMNVPVIGTAWNGKS